MNSWGWWVIIPAVAFFAILFGVDKCTEATDRRYRLREEFRSACGDKDGREFTTGDRFICVVDGKEVKVYPDGYQP